MRRLAVPALPLPDGRALPTSCDGMDSSPERHHCATTAKRPQLIHQPEEEPMSTLQIGVDLAKSVFEDAVSGVPG